MKELEMELVEVVGMHPNEFTVLVDFTVLVLWLVVLLSD